MKKIATHDSATGERPVWYTAWTVPFARTQSKTIAEQYAAGCRSFDIRLRKHKGEWHCAHGLFITRRKALDILAEIASFPDRCQVCLTYEGGTADIISISEFITIAEKLRHMFAHVVWGETSIKYGSRSSGVQVAYDTLLPPQKLYEGGVQGFLPLDGKTWHTLLPFPWLRNKIYTEPHEFNEQTYTFVDFL